MLNNGDGNKIKHKTGAAQALTYTHSLISLPPLGFASPPPFPPTTKHPKDPPSSLPVPRTPHRQGGGELAGGRIRAGGAAAFVGSGAQLSSAQLNCGCGWIGGGEELPPVLVVVGVVAEVTVKFSPSVASSGHHQHLHLNPSPSTPALPRLYPSSYLPCTAPGQSVRQREIQGEIAVQPKERNHDGVAGGGSLIDFIHPFIGGGASACCYSPLTILPPLILASLLLLSPSLPPSLFSPVLLPSPCSCIEVSKEQRVLCGQQLSLLHGRRWAP
jgi:hypothetical protein